MKCYSGVRAAGSCSLLFRRRIVSLSSLVASACSRSLLAAAAGDGGVDMRLLSRALRRSRVAQPRPRPRAERSDSAQYNSLSRHAGSRAQACYNPTITH